VIATLELGDSITQIIPLDNTCGREVLLRVERCKIDQISKYLPIQYFMPENILPKCKDVQGDESPDALLC